MMSLNELFDVELYGLLLLLLSPIVFIVLYCMVHYPIKVRYKIDTINTI